MATIDEFKANLVGGGARANQFRITFNTPTRNCDWSRCQKNIFLNQNWTIAGATIGEVAVTFRGRSLFLAGDREFEQWTTTVLNDTDFMIRNAMERWQNAMNDFQTNTGLTNVADYTADLTVEQLDRDDTVLKTYILRNCFPVSTSAIDLSYDATTEVETFDITWRYTHFEASSVNF